VQSLADQARRLKPPHENTALPSLILMTDSRRLAEPEPLVSRLPRGSAVILRHYHDPERAALAERLSDLCRRIGVRLLIAGDGRLTAAVSAGGLHLPEAMIAHAPRTWRLWRRPGWLVTAAAHSPAAIMVAARAGVDAVLLSPVFPTESHPGARVLGSLLFARWTSRSPLPVYALGGLSAATVGRLAASAAIGVATVGGLSEPSNDAA
jgi:thiamine-phosphate pyrophosphorylase